MKISLALHIGCVTYGVSDEWEIEMNKTDRAAIAKLIDQINLLNGQIEDVKSAAEDLQGSEQEKFDNLSENLQQGERGQAI